MNEAKLFTPEDPSFLLLLFGLALIVLFAAWVLARHGSGPRRNSPPVERIVAREIRLVLDELREVDTELQQLRAGVLLSHPTPHLRRHQRLLSEYRAVLASRLHSLMAAERLAGEIERSGRGVAA